jgi:hypothetical protein
MVFAVALEISILIDIQPGPEIEGFANTVVTNIGPVMMSEWHRTYESAIIGYQLNETDPYYLLLFLVSLFILFVSLAYRKSYSKYLLFVVIFAGVLSYAIANNNNNLNQQLADYDAASSGLLSYDMEERDTIDLDKLKICEASINYVFGQQSGEVYYKLKDEGFVLEKAFNGESRSYQPTREDLCQTYNTLRNNLPNENIVLQLYIIDSDGMMRPFDEAELYSESATKPSRNNTIQYGFFTKK